MEQDTAKTEARKNTGGHPPWPKGVSGNPKGLSVVDPVIRALRKEAKKRTLELLKEHEEELLAALPEIRPALVKQAKNGSLGHIQEIHKVVGAHKKQDGNVVAVQVNIGSDKEEFA